MGARNLSYRAALGIMAGMIAVAVLLGGGRSLRALRSDVEAVFWNGADGDGIGIASDLSKNSADAINQMCIRDSPSTPRQYPGEGWNGYRSVQFLCRQHP